MKITGFNPLILTKDAEAVIDVFEALGFEKRHGKTGVDFSSSRMKDSNGFHVDVTEAAVLQDVTTIRMNVSSFEEAYRILSDHGFKGVSDEKSRDTGSSRSAMMIAPFGFSITIVEHIKKEETR